MPTTSMKYPSDARACFGVAMRKKSDGTFEGVRCPPFPYTGCTVLGIKAYQKAEKAELARVRELGRQWGPVGHGYLERYREELVNEQPRWQVELRQKLRGPLHTICITELMDHVVKHSKAVYAGTPAADTFLIFHDHLSQWWEADAQKYLHERHGFRDRQLRCLGDVNKGTRYEGKLVGDSPELCRGLDSHGFSDLKRSMDYHVAISSTYPITDSRRFGMGTPQEVESTMFRCWTLEPRSERIVEDILGLPRVLDKIIENDGCVVPDEFLRTGRRQRRADDKGDLQNKPIARQRKSTNNKTVLCHPDAVEARDLFKTRGNLWELYENLKIAESNV
eukprot:Lithocolla_globosa_v1_NODE_141_length_5757_cov_121.254121.p2 type:complete len:335 gc:universal NODE_141_length_5757_cov_121.254121:3013-2009(-)